MTWMMTGVLLDIRKAIQSGAVDQAVNLVRNWQRSGGWSPVLRTDEIEALRAAGWEGDRV